MRHNKKLQELQELNQAMNYSKQFFREIAWEGDADENTITGSKPDPATEGELK
jgi:hypothetical protein